jgi:hypothetical protein
MVATRGTLADAILKKNPDELGDQRAGDPWLVGKALSLRRARP